jgi:hypothetical protein
MNNEKVMSNEYSPLITHHRLLLTSLFGCADFKDLRAAHRAGALLSRLAIFHRDLLSVLNFTLFLALHTVAFHDNLSSVV